MTSSNTHAPLLDAMLNLTRFHRDHEKYYAVAPRETAVVLQRHARTLQALADRWTTAAPQRRSFLSPFEGAEDLNDATATQLDGVLFMEGEQRPVEVTALIAELRVVGEGQGRAGDWLTSAMEASWAMAETLLEIPELADLLGERHRIIANDWQAAELSRLTGRVLERAAEVLERVDYAPEALRVDLDGPRRTPGRLYSAAEMIAHAADLCCASSGLVHDNERRWRVFRARVAEIVGASEHDPGG
jgi:hypothetical protein